MHAYIHTYIHTHTHTYAQSALNYTTVIASFIANCKLSEPFIDMTVCRRSEIGSDIFCNL